MGYNKINSELVCDTYLIQLNSLPTAYISLYSVLIWEDVSIFD